MSTPLDDALERLRVLIEEVSDKGVAESNTMALATAGEDGTPSIRTVYVLDIRPPGPAFFVNERSGKARQLAQNPRICLCFFSPAVQHQVIIDGFALRLEADESDRLWHLRPREAQLGAWASDSTQEYADTVQRRMRAREQREHSGFEPVARPDNWCAWRMQAQRVSIWHAGWQHLRSRTRYESDAFGVWNVVEANP